MHHSGMDMDHGHGGHGDMDMGGQCNMNVSSYYSLYWDALGITYGGSN